MPTPLPHLLADAGEGYNLHSHTQFCDGRAPMAVMAEAAAACGMTLWGFSPHSPLPNVAEQFGPQTVAQRFNRPSPCNMRADSVPAYLAEATRLRDEYDGRMRILTSMEIDFLGDEWGPHTNYFQQLPLDYRIGSVHFVPTQQGLLVDCDGSADGFRRNLAEYYRNDLRYVVEKYFGQQLKMLEHGGFDLLAHCDKIAANASAIQPDIEEHGWYQALLNEVFDRARDAGVLLEINTKSLDDRGRFFPHSRWWPRLAAAGHRLVIDSDAHRPERVNAGRPEALTLLAKLTL